MQHGNTELRTCLGIPFAHAFTATASTLYGANYAVNICSSAPFLMRENIHAEFFLSPLNELDVGQHTILLELF